MVEEEEEEKEEEEKKKKQKEKNGEGTDLQEMHVDGVAVCLEGWRSMEEEMIDEEEKEEEEEALGHRSESSRSSKSVSLTP